MQIVEAATLGSFEHYALIERERPTPTATQVLIQVAACSLGYADALVALGRYQVKPPVPHTPGTEIAGTVVALGPAASGLSVGDRVMAQTKGGMAEFVTADRHGVWRVPAGVSFAQAAALRVNYLTADRGLRERAGLLSGERLLVLGAAGGVGAAAVQIGRHLGAEVIAVASTSEKRSAAERNGASATLDSEPEAWRQRLALVAPGGVDVVFDPVCGPLFEPAFRSLRWGGRHLVVGFTHGGIPALPANLPLLKGSALVGVDVRQYAERYPEEAHHAVERLLQLTAAGELAPGIGEVFPLHAARAALETAFSGRAIGKVVVQVG